MGILLSKGKDIEVEGVTIEGTSIYIKGTDIELPTAYARIEFKASLDGRTLTIYPSVFLNQNEYLKGNELTTNVNTNPFEVNILETEIQSIDTALSYSVEKFIDYGFSAEII
jgi:hypothetical protein